jgi:hypothetical protein
MGRRCILIIISGCIRLLLMPVMQPDISAERRYAHIGIEQTWLGGISGIGLWVWLVGCMAALPCCHIIISPSATPQQHTNFFFPCQYVIFRAGKVRRLAIFLAFRTDLTTSNLHET